MAVRSIRCFPPSDSRSCKLGLTYTQHCGEGMSLWAKRATILCTSGTKALRQSTSLTPRASGTRLHGGPFMSTPSASRQPWPSLMYPRPLLCPGPRSAPRAASCTSHVCRSAPSLVVLMENSPSHVVLVVVTSCCHPFCHELWTCMLRSVCLQVSKTVLVPCVDARLFHRRRFFFSFFLFCASVMLSSVSTAVLCSLSGRALCLCVLCVCVCAPTQPTPWQLQCRRCPSVVAAVAVIHALLLCMLLLSSNRHPKIAMPLHQAVLWPPYWSEVYAGKALYAISVKYSTLASCQAKHTLHPGDRLACNSSLQVRT